MTTAVGLKAGRKGFEPLNGFYTVNRLAGGPNRPLWHLPKKPTLLPGKVYTLLVKRKAEGEGFEPSVGCCLLRFSRPSQSSTLPSLQAVEGVISTRSRSITRHFLHVNIESRCGENKMTIIIIFDCNFYWTDRCKNHHDSCVWSLADQRSKK